MIRNRAFNWRSCVDGGRSKALTCITSVARDGMMRRSHRSVKATTGLPNPSGKDRAVSIRSGKEMRGGDISRSVNGSLNRILESSRARRWHPRAVPQDLLCDATVESVSDYATAALSCAFMRSGANAAERLSDALAQVENARHRTGRCVLYHATVSSITWRKASPP